jgi:hypothetical protein
MTIDPFEPAERTTDSNGDHKILADGPDTGQWEKADQAELTKAEQDAAVAAKAKAEHNAAIAAKAKAEAEQDTAVAAMVGEGGPDSTSHQLFE